MKQIIIFLLLIIVVIIGYNTFKKHKRFSLENYEYKIPDLDTSEADKETLLDYYRAVERVNGYVISQWSTEGIDVRNPEDDDETTRAAVTRYRELLADVGYFEKLLTTPEKKPVTTTKPPTEEELRKNLLRKTFYADPSAYSLRIGEQNAIVYEIQHLLIKHGDSIRHDGLFRTETFNSLRQFEEKNGLFPDGKLDAITLEYLLR